MYLNHLHLFDNSATDITGAYIDEQERISAEQDYAEFVNDLFITQMQNVFDDAPRDIRLEQAGEELPLLPRYREYLLGLLPLFTEVLKVEAKYNAFDVVPNDKTEYPKWRKFVTAVLLKPLRSGKSINHYVKNFTNAPHYVQRLIEKIGNNYYLKSVDINGYEYIFALFSLMQFMNAENDKILELKMLEWERRHRNN